MGKLLLLVLPRDCRPGYSGDGCLKSAFKTYKTPRRSPRLANHTYSHSTGVWCPGDSTGVRHPASCEGVAPPASPPARAAGCGCLWFPHITIITLTAPRSHLARLYTQGPLSGGYYGPLRTLYRHYLAVTSVGVSRGARVSGSGNCELGLWLVRGAGRRELRRRFFLGGAGGGGVGCCCTVYIIKYVYIHVYARA